MPLPRIKSRPLPPLSQAADPSGGSFSRLQAAARRDINDLENSAQLSASQLSALVVRAQQTFQDLEALSTSVTDQFTALQTLLTDVNTQVETVNTQVLAINELIIELNQQINEASSYRPPEPTSLTVLESAPGEHTLSFSTTLLPPAGGIDTVRVEAKVGSGGWYVVAERAFQSGFQTMLHAGVRRRADVLYRVYTVKDGRSSVPTSVTFLAAAQSDAAGVQDVRVVRDSQVFTVLWKNPLDTRLGEVRVYLDRAPDAVTLTEARARAAGVVYAGLAEQFVYEIPFAIRNDKFRVWIETVAAT